MKKILLILTIFTISYPVQAQIGIGATVPHPSAALDISSPMYNKGILIPRLTATQRTGIPSPAIGLMVYETSSNSFWYFNGSIWNQIGNANGLILPYSGSQNLASPSTVFTIGNTGNGDAIIGNAIAGDGVQGNANSGRGVVGKSYSSVGVRGESHNYTGMQGVSQNGIGVYGESDADYGVFGNSRLSNGVLGTSYYNHGVKGESVLYYGIYGKSTYGNAGFFEGKVKVTGDVFVDTDKGIIQNTTGTQLKYYKGSVALDYTLGAFATYITDVISMENFSSAPAVYVANISGQSGEYYKVIITPVSVTANSFRLRFYNASDTSSTFGGTWNIVAIGAK
jgi:hypothetical protein